MSKEPIIRKACLDDVNGNFDLISAGPISWSKSAVTSSLKEPYLTLVSEIKQDIVGFCSGILVMDEMQIVNVVVAPYSRRQRIGSDLIIALAKIAKENGAQKVFLEVGVENHAAIHTYSTLGFCTVVRRSRFYSNGEDALVMTIDINQLVNK